jgi:hypothetical protein
VKRALRMVMEMSRLMIMVFIVFPSWLRVEVTLLLSIATAMPTWGYPQEGLVFGRVRARGRDKSKNYFANNGTHLASRVSVL